MKIDELQVYRGRDLEITKGIVMRQPTLGEIESDGESHEMDFFETCYTLIATPTDMMAQLDKIGIRYEDVTNFELFMMLFPSLPKEKVHLLFRNLEPADYERTLVENQGRYILANPKINSFIDEVVYHDIVDYVCAVMRMKQTEKKTPGNAFSRRIMLDVAYMDWEAAKERKAKSFLQPLVSTMVNLEGFKSDWSTVWDMKIGAFMDAVQRTQIIVSSKALLDGCYSGNIDTKKIKTKELDYMRELGH